MSVPCFAVEGEFCPALARATDRWLGTEYPADSGRKRRWLGLAEGKDPASSARSQPPAHPVLPTHALCVQLQCNGRPAEMVEGLPPTRLRAPGWQRQSSPQLPQVDRRCGKAV